MRFFFPSISLHITQIVPNSVFHCMRACFIATFNEMFKFTGITKHFSQAAQSLINNLTESHDFKRFTKMELLKMKFQSRHLKYEGTLKRSHKKGKKGFIRNSSPAMPFTPARLPFSKKKKVPWVKKSILVNKTSGVQT